MYAVKDIFYSSFVNDQNVVWVVESMNESLFKRSNPIDKKVSRNISKFHGLRKSMWVQFNVLIILSTQSLKYATSKLKTTL
jgi:hypothetical protein